MGGQILGNGPWFDDQGFSIWLSGEFALKQSKRANVADVKKAGAEGYKIGSPEWNGKVKDIQVRLIDPSFKAEAAKIYGSTRVVTDKEDKPIPYPVVFIDTLENFPSGDANKNYNKSLQSRFYRHYIGWIKEADGEKRPAIINHKSNDCVDNVIPAGETIIFTGKIDDIVIEGIKFAMVTVRGKLKPLNDTIEDATPFDLGTLKSKADFRTSMTELHGIMEGSNPDEGLLMSLEEIAEVSKSKEHWDSLRWQYKDVKIIGGSRRFITKDGPNPKFRNQYFGALVQGWTPKEDPGPIYQYNMDKDTKYGNEAKVGDNLLTIEMYDQRDRWDSIAKKVVKGEYEPKVIILAVAIDVATGDIPFSFDVDVSEE